MLLRRFLKELAIYSPLLLPIFIVVLSLVIIERFISNEYRIKNAMQKYCQFQKIQVGLCVARYTGAGTPVYR